MKKIPIFFKNSGKINKNDYKILKNLIKRIKKILKMKTIKEKLIKIWKN